MTRTRTSGGRGLRRRRGVLVAASVATALVAAIALSAFHMPVRMLDATEADAPSEVTGDAIIGIRTFTAPSGIEVVADLEYATQSDGTLLTLDVCLPAVQSETGSDNDVAGETNTETNTETKPEADAATALSPQDGAAVATAAPEHPAVVSVHGGSWARGDKANDDWRNVCLWLASEGFVAASVNYRLVPDAHYPAQIDDVSRAVEWLREPEQLERFGIDPARIGAFGGSAGGHLVSLLGARGEGSQADGARVAAVAEISGPVALEAASLRTDNASQWLQGIVARFLDCDIAAPADAAAEVCPQASEASPATWLDASDPPFFIAHADDEIVPLGQSVRLAAAVRAAGVSVEFVTLESTEHSIGLLDEALRTRVATFLHSQLDPSAA